MYKSEIYKIYFKNIPTLMQYLIHKINTIIDKRCDTQKESFKQQKTHICRCSIKILIYKNGNWNLFRKWMETICVRQYFIRHAVSLGQMSAEI